MGGLRVVYDHLPPKARSLAGSVRGYSLLSWRYGPETEKLAAEALEREAWNHARWKTWQEERLGDILQRAATRVP